MSSDESEDLLLPINFWRKLQGLNNKPLSEARQQCSVGGLHQTDTATLVEGQPNLSHGATVKIVRKRKLRKGPVLYSDTDSGDEDVHTKADIKKEIVPKDSNTELHREAGVSNKDSINSKHDFKERLLDFKTDDSHASQSFIDNMDGSIGDSNVEQVNVPCNPSVYKVEDFAIDAPIERGHNCAKNDTSFETSKRDKRCEDTNVIHETNSSSSIEDFDNSEMEKSFYTCRKKLKISRSRFGAFRRKNYKYGPIIFSDDELKTNGKYKEIKKNGNRDSSSRVVVSANPLPLGSDVVVKFYDNEKLLTVNKGTTNHTDKKNDFAASSAHKTAQKVELMHSAEISVDGTDNHREPDHHILNYENTALSHVKSTRKKNTDCIVSTKTEQAVNSMNELFFGEESCKVKPAPGKSKALRSDDLFQSEVSNTKSPEKHEVTLLDDNSLWSSPKK